MDSWSAQKLDHLTEERLLSIKIPVVLDVNEVLKVLAQYEQQQEDAESNG